jgi:hypothetical protein
MQTQHIKSAALLFATLTFFLFSAKFFLLKNEKENDAIRNADKIDKILSNSFNQSENILIAIGRKIVFETQDLEPKAIHKIFVESAKIEICSNTFSWSLFDWVDNEGFQVVNTFLGVRKDAPRIGIERSYLNHGNKPWKINFSEIAVGVPSGMPIIPVGIQIESSKKGRLGVVAAGIDITKLSKIVNSELEKNVSFLVLDHRSNQLTFGSELLGKDSGKIFNRMIEELNGKKYLFEKKMDPRHPYKILTGYDIKDFWREVFNFSFKLATKIFLIIAGVTFLVKKINEI